MRPRPGRPGAFMSGIAPLPGSVPPTTRLSRQPQGRTRSINMRVHLGLWVPYKSSILLLYCHLNGACLKQATQF